MLKTRKILLVEDDRTTQFMMTEMLDAVGIEFEVANDGQECVEKLEKDAGRFDAVLLDIHMPRKSGLAALSEIRADENDPPKNMHVVALTADTAWHNKSKVQREGFNDLLIKPVTMEKILAVLD